MKNVILVFMIMNSVLGYDQSDRISNGLQSSKNISDSTFDINNYNSQDVHEQKILDFLRKKIHKILEFLHNMQNESDLDDKQYHLLSEIKAYLNTLRKEREQFI